MSVDYDIECFWYGLKDSIINALGNLPDIVDMSDKLNQYQKNSDYTNIEKCIRQYISEFCFMYMVSNVSKHHVSIMLTNIRRWNRLRSDHKFDNLSDIRIVSITCALFDIYNKHIYSRYKSQELITYYSKLTKYGDYNIDLLIDICINCEFPQYLDILSPIYDVSKYIGNKYSVTLYGRTKGSKILNKIKHMRI